MEVGSFESRLLPYFRIFKWSETVGKLVPQGFLEAAGVFELAAHAHNVVVAKVASGSGFTENKLILGEHNFHHF